MRHLPAASALVLLPLSACGGSSDPAAGTDALASPSSSFVVSAAPTPALAGTASAAPTPTRAVVTSPAAVSPTPRRTTASVTPSPTPQPSPKPSPRSSPTPKPTPRLGPTHPLEMAPGYRFSPMSLSIAVGDAVRAHNSDTINHTFTGPTWDSGDVAPGAYARVFRFNTAGTFRFVCTPHEGVGMTGTLTVR